MDASPNPDRLSADPGNPGSVAERMSNSTANAGAPSEPGASAILNQRASTSGAHAPPAVMAGAGGRWILGGGREWKSDHNGLGLALMTPIEAGSHVAPNSGLLVADRPSRSNATRIYEVFTDPQQWLRILLVSDFVVLYLASCLALLANTPVRAITGNRWLAVAFPLLVVTLMRARRSPDSRLNVSLIETFAYVLSVVSLSTMLVIAAETLLGSSDPTQMALRLWLFGAVYLGVARFVLVAIRRKALTNEGAAAPTLIVGAGKIGAHLVHRLRTEPSYGLHPVGFLDADPLLGPEAAHEASLPVLGGPEDLQRTIVNTGARHVILAFSSEPDQVLVAKVRECQAMGVDVSLVPRLYESINERATLDHVGGLPLLTLHHVDPRGWQFTIKHAIDRIAAAAALLLAAPVMLALALAVRLSSPGPILFRQQRVGRDGHTFEMLKFRTMRGTPSAAGEADADWAATILHGMPSVPHPVPAPIAEKRTTAVGQFLRDYSLDELPQLINVLRGDMSLVGPRPERVAYVRDFETQVEHYSDRHRVKSGLTGWAQVNGLRGKTSIADRVEWDNYYIQNWSLRLDLRIMVLTLAEVFRARDSADSRPASTADPGSGRAEP
jgi:exopolysaccharide biosynthesis polyprenyl glycosylphosphotransferase